jgi:GNAT superfamily N-acetyltransferase
MLIRPFVSGDLAPAAALLRRAAVDFILHESTPDGACDFLARHGEDGLRANLDAGFVYHAAEVDGELAGFIGMRERSHLFHLFVDARRQRRGIARRLWVRARDAALGPGDAGIFTVNASNHALPFYTALGFERTAPMQVAAVPYNPMRLTMRRVALLDPAPHPNPGPDSVLVAPA